MRSFTFLPSSEMFCSKSLLAVRQQGMPSVCPTPSEEVVRMQCQVLGLALLTASTSLLRRQ